jgi:hypothetical protein
MSRGQAFQKTKTKTKTKNPRKQTKFKNECYVLSFFLEKNFVCPFNHIQGLLKKNEKKQARSFIFRSLNKFGDFDLSHLSH